MATEQHPLALLSVNQTDKEVTIPYISISIRSVNPPSLNHGGMSNSFIPLFFLFFFSFFLSLPGGSIPFDFKPFRALKKVHNFSFVMLFFKKILLCVCDRKEVY